MLRLRSRLLPLLRAATPLPAHIHPRPCCLLSTSSPLPFSIEDYLVASCGLAPTQACEVSKKLSRQLLSTGRRRSLDEVSHSRLNSASNPDAIIALLAGVGLSRADIAAVVSADPLLLRASVKNISSRLLVLRDRIGLSDPQIARLLLVDSRALRSSDFVPKLEFFISFYGSFEKSVVSLKRNIRLLSTSIDKSVKPNIGLLRQWGVPNIAQLCSYSPRLLTYNQERLKECLMRAEEIGVPPTSRPFGQAVVVFSSMSKEKVAAKLEFFRRILGCSDSDISTSVSKKPNILAFSEKTLLRKIEFLLNEAAMEPRNIVERPVLLTYSLEKRLVPRHNVMKALQEKGLMNNNTKLFTILQLGAETFKLKFIDRYKDSVPGLADAYAAARAGIVPCRV